MNQNRHHPIPPLELDRFAMSNFAAINPLTHGKSEYDRDQRINPLNLDVNADSRSRNVIVTYLGNVLNTERQILDCGECLVSLKSTSNSKSRICSPRNHLISSGKGVIFVEEPASFIRFSPNWAHFVEDNLPAFHKLVSKSLGRDVYVQGEMALAQEELLRTLFPELKMVQMQEGYSYFFRDVIFNFHRDSRNEAIQGIRSLQPMIDHESMLSIRSLIMNLTPSTSQGKRRLFISRRHRGFRKLANLMEVEKLLQNHGFTIVYPELLALNERVSLFRSAELIIGESGAGMANCYFAPDHIPIIELRHPGNSKSVEQLGLISITHQKYFIIEGRTTNLFNKLKYGSDTYIVNQSELLAELVRLGFL
jgi:hypothetical protein